MIAPGYRTPAAALGFIALLCLPAPALIRAADPDPAPALEGSWTWTWNDRDGRTHRHVMEVEGKGAKLAAREIFDDQGPVRVQGLTLDGRSVKFSVVRGERRSDYKGKVVDADHIDGLVLVTAGGEANEFPWKAERRKENPK